jgi:hypothetical protein
MANQLIVTSVPRGLDGGDGYQAVMRSQGIPPRVAERLKLRSGYSHPFPHGDKRNPIVYFHRIEDVGGGRWHLLGCIRDAGSDHTGRSNFLAHMLAVDSAEARKKSGGPAVVALKSRFRERWEGPPEAAAKEMVLIGSDDEPRPGDCPAWKNLDPGLAGDLAQAAMEGKRLVLVSRPDDDGAAVLAMFVDAMRLVDPAKRWGVTFNTCAIEAFEGTWKAIRADLLAAGQVRESRDPVIDLTTDPKGSDGAYARFARGETDRLPWQRAVASQPAARDVKIEAGRGEPLAAGRGGRSQVSGTAAAAETGKPGRRPPRGIAASRVPIDEDSAGRRVWRVLAIGGVACVLLLAAVAYVQRERLVAFVSNKPSPPPPIESDAAPPTVPIRPAIDDGKTKDWERQKAIDEARNRLTAGINGRTHDVIREDAEKLEQEIERLRRDEGLDIKADPDPLDRVALVVNVCSRVQDLLEKPTGELKTAELGQAFEELAAQDDAFRKLWKEIDKVAADERAKKQQLADMAKQKTIEADRQKAFEDFTRLVPVVELPTPSGGVDIGDRPTTTGPAAIDFGRFAAADLVDPRFRLAVPRDTINGKPFVATITVAESEAGSEPKWVIQYQPQDVSIDGKTQKPRRLATLVARANRLVLEVPKSNELAQRPFALLRRSVILAEARDPAGGDAAPIVKEIRLVKPVTVGPLTIDPFGERQSFTIATPPAIQSHDTPPGQDRPIPYVFPVAGIEIKADLMGTRVDMQLPRDAKEGTDPGIGEWQLTLAALHPEAEMLSLAMDVTMTVRLATLTVTPKLVGKKANLVTLEMVRRNFIDKPEKALLTVLAAFDRRVRDCPGHDFGKAQTAKGAEIIKNWLAGPLATVQSMCMTLPGHETIAASFDLYVKERHAEDPTTPVDGAAWLESLKGIKDADTWNTHFSGPLNRWAAWFRLKFQPEWQEYAKGVAGALKTSHEVRIEAITSLAYDEAGKEYKVPLVVFDEKASQPGASRAAGNAASKTPPGGGKQAGID